MPTPAARRADKGSARPARGDLLPFLRAWLAAPLRVAAIAPSSPGLARAITAEIGPATGPVIEFGPGTGVFTQAILDAGVPPEQLIMIEAGAAFARLLRDRFPRRPPRRGQRRRAGRRRAVRSRSGRRGGQRPADPVDAQARRPRHPRHRVQ